MKHDMIHTQGYMLYVGKRNTKKQRERERERQRERETERERDRERERQRDRETERERERERDRKLIITVQQKPTDRRATKGAGRSNGGGT
jgi:hypothetical protein